MTDEIKWANLHTLSVNNLDHRFMIAKEIGKCHSRVVACNRGQKNQLSNSIFKYKITLT